MKNRILLVAMAACFVAAGITTAFAQGFPTRPIRMIVPLSPGSGADIVGRIIAKYMGVGLGKAVVVENLPGAGGQIGTLAAVKAPADGYTVMVQSASHGANPAIYKALQYDSLKDLVDLAILGVTPYVMVVSPTSPYPSIRAVVEAAKAKPEQLPFASVGIGSVTHLVGEYFAQMAGIRLLHVPYKGGPEAIRDVAAGRVAFYMSPINTAIGLIKDGKLKAIGVSTLRRADVLPEVPTLDEQGIAGFNMTLWYGMWVPAGTPQTVVRKLNEEVKRILQLPEVRKQYATLGVDPVSMSPEDFAKFVRQEIATNQRIVKQAGIEQQ